MEDKPPAYNPGIPPAAGPPPPYSPAPPLGFQQQQPQIVHTQQVTPSSAVVVTQPVVTAATPVVVVTGGVCPACRVGFLRNDFTCMGIFLAICCFPVGLVCCFLMMERRCSNCGLTFA